MITLEDTRRLPEFQNEAVENPDYKIIDEVDTTPFVDDNTLVVSIMQTNPETGFPANDIDILESTSNEQVRDYLLRCMKVLRSVDNSNLTDEDLEQLHFSKFDTSESYITRLKDIADGKPITKTE